MQELRKKISKLAEAEVSQNLGLSTLKTNFSRENDELTSHEEEILVFCETLAMLQIPIPEVLNEKLLYALSTKKISARKIDQFKTGGNADKENRNNFLTYTTNKILSEICEDLTAPEVIA